MKGSLPPNWLLLIRKTVGVAGAGKKSLCKETKYLRGQYSCLFFATVYVQTYVLWINNHVKELKRKQTAFHSQLLLAYTVS